jgi:hypothetical protein
VLGLLAAPIPATRAGTAVVYADESTPAYVIFFSEGPTWLSDVAGETIQMAADDAGRAAGQVRLVGPADCAATVKDALVRGGVAANTIRVTARDGALDDSADEPATVDIYVEPATARVHVRS